MNVRSTLIALGLGAVLAAPSLIAQSSNKGETGPAWLGGGASAQPDGTPTTSFNLNLGTRQTIGACDFTNPLPVNPTVNFNLGAGGIVMRLGAAGQLRSINPATFASEAAIMHYGAVRPGETIRLRPLVSNAATFTLLPFDIALIDLSDNGLPNITLGAAGVFTLAFCETFVDATPPAPDAQFENLVVRLAGTGITAPNPITQSTPVPVNSPLGLGWLVALVAGVGLLGLRRRG